MRCFCARARRSAAIERPRPSQSAPPPRTRGQDGSARRLIPRCPRGVTTVADYRVRFPTSSGTFSAPPSTGSYSANVWIEDDASLYTSAGTNSVGISFDNTQPFPIGEYDFEVKGTELTFTDVRTHTLEELNAGTNLVIPFLKLTTREPGCTGWSCQVASFDYKWMKRTEAGWVEATAQEVACRAKARSWSPITTVTSRSLEQRVKSRFRLTHCRACLPSDPDIQTIVQRINSNALELQPV